MQSNYFDLQVNGYAGVDFNGDDVSIESMRTACERLREDGVDGILATVITDDLKRMKRRLKGIAKACKSDKLVGDVIRGIHIEGPFISPITGYVGAHPVDHVTLASANAMQELLTAANGLTRLVTLAPEYDKGFEVIRLLAEQDIAVAAGHCNPSLATLGKAIEAGLSLFTHLGNGCPMKLHRHDNIIQRALHFSDQLWITFIADGAHIPYPTLKNYFMSAGLDRCIVISDAISAAGMGPGRYRLGHQEVDVGDDGIVWAPDRSHFVGAASTLKQVEARMRTELGLAADILLALTSGNPRKALGLD